MSQSVSFIPIRHDLYTPEQIKQKLFLRVVWGVVAVVAGISAFLFLVCVDGLVNRHAVVSIFLFCSSPFLFATGIALILMCRDGLDPVSDSEFNELAESIDRMPEVRAVLAQWVKDGHTLIERDADYLRWLRARHADHVSHSMRQSVELGLKMSEPGRQHGG